MRTRNRQTVRHPQRIGAPRHDDQSNWIFASGQGWKLYVALAGFGGGLLCFSAAVLSLSGSSMRVVGLCIIVGSLLCVSTFLWLITVLRCPHCRAKLVWTTAKSRPHSSWMIDLAGLDSCPMCSNSLVQSRRSAP